jgi:DNA repair ATPase RecN
MTDDVLSYAPDVEAADLQTELRRTRLRLEGARQQLEARLTDYHRQSAHLFAVEQQLAHTRQLLGEAQEAIAALTARAQRAEDRYSDLVNSRSGRLLQKARDQYRRARASETFRRLNKRAR